MYTCKKCKRNFPSISGVNFSINRMDKKNDMRLDLLEQKIDNLDVSMKRQIAGPRSAICRAPDS